jgi:adenosylhomocysteine nucleosidase
VIAILGALQSELKPFHRYARLETLRRTPAASFAEGRWHGHDVVLVRTGIGKVHAAMGTQATLDRYAPERIVVVGSAGALDESLPLGTILIPREVAPHDVGSFFPDGFRPGGRTVATPGGWKRFVQAFPCASEWVAAALACAREQNLPAVEGRLVTGDQAVFSTTQRDWLRRTFDALAVDMESAAIAQVAAAHDVPLLVLRALSDYAGDETGFDTTPLRKATGDKPAVLGAVSRRLHHANFSLRHPRSAWRRRRFEQGVASAADNVALLLDKMWRE